MKPLETFYFHILKFLFLHKFKILLYILIFSCEGAALEVLMSVCDQFEIFRF